MFGKRPTDRSGVLIARFFDATTLIVFAAVLATGAPAQNKKHTFAEHVLPIFESNCISCHNAGRASGGLALDSFDRIMEGGGSGDVVKVGDAESSKLFRLVSHADTPKMPPGSKLGASELQVIRRWIQGGALKNRKSKAPKRPNVNAAFAVATTRGKPDGPPPLPPRLALEPVTAGARANPVATLAASPWAPLVAVGGYKQILLYDANGLRLRGVLPFPEGTPHVLRFSGDGGRLIAGGGRNGKSGRVVVWDVRTGKRILTVGKEYDAVLAADLSADQTKIAIGGPGKVVRVYATQDGRLLYELKKHTDWITSIAFSPDGVLLATGDRAGNLFVWESADGAEYLAPKAHKGRVTAIDWRADSNAFATASEDRTVVVWRAEDGRSLRRLTAHAGGALAVSYHRDGRFVTAGRDRTLKLWKPDGKGIRTLKGLADIALTAAFSDDGKHVIGGDWRGNIHCWRIKDGKRVAATTANPPAIAARLKRLAARQTKIAAKVKQLEGAARDRARTVSARRALLAEYDPRHEKAKKRAAAARQVAARAKQAYRAASRAIDPVARREGRAVESVKRALAALRDQHRLEKLARTASAPAARIARQKKRVRASIAAAEKEFRKAKQRLDKAKGERANITHRLARWREEAALAECLATFERTAAALDEAKAARTALRRWERATEKEVEQIEADRETWTESIPRYRTAIKTLAARRGRLGRLESETRAQLKLAESMLAFAKNADDLGRYVTSLEAAAQKEASGMTGATRLLVKAAARVGGISAQLTAEKKAAAATVGRLKALVQAATKGSRGGEAAIAAAKKDLTSLEQRIAKAGDRWQDLQIAISEVDEKRAATEKAVKAASRAHDIARRKLDAQRSRLDEALVRS